MGILSDKDFVDSLIAQDRFEEAKKACKQRKWGELANKVGIFPFQEDNLGPFSYDLAIGDQGFIQRKGESINLKPGDHIDIEPGATVVILTLEYIVLSKTFGAIIQPKARYLMEGIAQCSAKADPTWYGRLAIAVTNTYNETMSFRHGEPFCTMIVFQLDKPVSRILTKREVPFLGQEMLEIVPSHARRWKARKEEAVAKEEMDNVVDLFGPPFDVIRGMFRLHKNEMYEYLDAEWGKTAIKEIKHSLWEDEITYLRDANTRSLWALILAIVGWIGIVAGFVFLLFRTIGKG